MATDWDDFTLDHGDWEYVEETPCGRCGFDTHGSDVCPVCEADYDRQRGCPLCGRTDGTHDPAEECGAINPSED